MRIAAICSLVGLSLAAAAAARSSDFNAVGPDGPVTPCTCPDGT
jgi:hypothetical protein